MKRYLTILLCVCFMAGMCACSGRPPRDEPQPPASSDESSGEPQSVTNEEPEPTEPSIPQEETGDKDNEEILLETGIIRIDEINDHNELDAPPVRAVINQGLYSIFESVRGIKNGGLHGLVEFNADRLIDYCMGVFVKSHASADFPFSDYPAITKEPDGKKYRISAADIATIAQKALADGDIALKFKSSGYYDKEQDAFLYPVTYDNYSNYGFPAFCFEVTVTRRGGIITAIVEWSQEDGTPVATMTITFEGEGPDDCRLADAQLKTANPGKIKITGNYTPVTLGTEIGIVGAIGNTVLAAQYFDGVLYLCSLDSRDFSEQKRLELTCEAAIENSTWIPRYFQRDMLFLDLGDRVVVVDKDLNVLFNESLPEPIMKAFQAGSVFNYDTGDWDSYFGGYTVAPDFSHYVYSVHGGVYRYDRATGKNTKLFDSFGYGSSLVGELNLHEPRYNADMSALYCIINQYEGVPDYYRYDPSSGTGRKISGKEVDISFINSPEFSGFGDYFGMPFAYGNTEFLLGAKYMTSLKSTYTDEGCRYELNMTPLGEKPLDTPLLTVDGANEFTIRAELDGGRLLFAASRAYVNDSGTYVYG